MAATYKVIYKNHCTPQEEVGFSTGSRWYLDSDCGEKLSGIADITVDGTKNYVSNLAVTDSASVELAGAGGGDDFVFIKNTGGGSGDDVLITLDDSLYYILLSTGECFASKISTSATVKAKCASSEDSTIEYFVGT